LDVILKHDKNHLYHDELAEINDSFYFAQFIEQAAAFRLQYLGEADFFEMYDHGYSAETRQSLAQLASNRLLREQYLDFLKCRRFRQTLLCHAERPLRRDPDVNAVAGFVARAPLDDLGQPDLRPEVTLKGRTTRGALIETDYPVGKAALSLLSKAWPCGMEVSQLHHDALAVLAKNGLPAASDAEPLSKFCEFLFQLFSAGIIQLHTFLPIVPSQCGPNPVVYPVARRQAQTGSVVTTVYHQPAKLDDEVALFLIRSLDGTLDRSMILDQLWRLLTSRGALECAPGEEQKVRESLSIQLEKNLNSLARMGLLVA
jgi:methyltransferase-like protein